MAQYVKIEYSLRELQSLFNTELFFLYKYFDTRI